VQLNQNTLYDITSKNSKIHKTAVIVDSVIGDNCIIAPFAILNKGCKIGDNSIIGPFNVLERGVKVGKNVTIGPHGVFAIDTIIEDNCFFGPHFSCANDRLISYGEHGTSLKKLPFQEFPIKIKKGAMLGTRCTVAPGVTIGEGARLDMCSFVTKDVKAFSHMRSSKKIVAELFKQLGSS